MICPCCCWQPTGEAHFNGHTLSRVAATQIMLGDFTPHQARRLIRDRLGTDQLPLVLEQRLGLRDRHVPGIGR